MLSEVVVCSVCNAPKLAPTKREFIFKVCSCFGIEAKLLLVVVTKSEVILADVKRIKPITAEASPIIKPFKVSAGFAEKFKLHLLKFSYTEDELTRCNLVTEGFAYLCNTERNFLSCCSLHVCKVYKNTLCSFRTEINFVLSILSNALEGFKHKVELADIGKVVSAAIRARNIVLLNISSHFLVTPTCNICAVKAFNQVVCSVPCFTFAAVHKRVREAAEVT